MKQIQFTPIEVVTYSGYKADERPVSFLYGNIRYTIENIVDRWYEGGEIAGRKIIHYYKVDTERNEQFLLKHDPEVDRWEASRTKRSKLDN